MTLKRLPLHIKIVLCSVYHLKKAGIEDAVTGDVYGVYEEICAKLNLEPLMQGRVREFILELDAVGALNARIMSLGRILPYVRLAVSSNFVEIIYSRDSQIRQIIDQIPKSISIKGQRG